MDLSPSTPKRISGSLVARCASRASLRFRGRDLLRGAQEVFLKRPGAATPSKDLCKGF